MSVCSRVYLKEYTLYSMYVVCVEAFFQSFHTLLFVFLQWLEVDTRLVTIEFNINIIAEDINLAWKCAEELGLTSPHIIV